MAGLDRSSDEGAAGTDAARFDPDDNERLWTSNVVHRNGKRWKGCGDGAQADESESERLNCDFLIGSKWE